MISVRYEIRTNDLATEMGKWAHSDRKNGCKKSKEKNFPDPTRQKSAQSVKYSQSYIRSKFQQISQKINGFRDYCVPEIYIFCHRSRIEF